MYLLDISQCKEVNGGGIIGTATGFVLASIVATPILFIAAIARSGTMTYGSFHFIKSMEDLAGGIINAGVDFGNYLENKIWGVAPSTFDDTA